MGNTNGQSVMAPDLVHVILLTMAATVLAEGKKNPKAANGETEPKPLRSSWSKHGGARAIRRLIMKACVATRHPTRPPSSNCGKRHIRAHTVVLTTVVHLPDMTQHLRPVRVQHWHRVPPSSSLPVPPFPFPFLFAPLPPLPLSSAFRKLLTVRNTSELAT